MLPCFLHGPETLSSHQQHHHHHKQLASFSFSIHIKGGSLIPAEAAADAEMELAESVCTQASADVESGTARGHPASEEGGPPSPSAGAGVAPEGPGCSSCSREGQAQPAYFSRLCVQLVIVAAAVVWALVLLVRRPVVRGAFCNDRDISLPYLSQSISSLDVFWIGTALPAFIIILVELLLSAVRATQDKEQQQQQAVVVLRRRMPETVVQIYTYCGALGLSSAFVFLVTNAIKAAVGSLRPHFLAVCLPDWSRVRCTDSSGLHEVYVDDFFCTGKPSLIEEARRSFPSGHTSCSSCGLVFAVLYLQYRLVWQQGSTAPKRHLRQKQTRWGVAAEQLYWVLQAAAPLVQFVLLMLALYVPSTRVVEHFHRIGDVLAGMAIGVFTALFGFFFVIYRARGRCMRA